MTSVAEERLSILINLCGTRDKASSRVRGYWIGEELESQGHRITYFNTFKRSDYLRLALEIPRHDIIVFQKSYSRYDVWLMHWTRLYGKRSYFDMDDAPSRGQITRTIRNAGKMMGLSDGVLAGSRALVDFALPYQDLTYLVASGIRLANYRVIETDGHSGPVCLGWIGNGKHYVRDLVDVLVEPLGELAARYPIRFRIVGACGESQLYEAFGNIEGLSIDFIDNVNWSSPDAVSEAIEPFDIGLYPLMPGPFNDYKCGFKALEYMASGLPVVASPTGANRDVIRHGKDGFLAITAQDWVEALDRLICDQALRSTLGTHGRSRVEEEFSTASLAKQLTEIFTRDSRLRPEASMFRRLSFFGR